MPFNNKGSQDPSIAYGENIDDKSINQRFGRLVPVGIYEGLELTKTGSNEVEVSPGLVHIGDGQGNYIKIPIESSFKVSPVNQSQEFVAVQWDYRAEEGWYAKIDSFGAVSSNMILLGKAVFDNNGNINDIDFRNRDRVEYEKGLRVRDTFETHGARVVDPIKVDTDSFSIGLQGRSFSIRTDQLNNAPTVTLPTGTDLQHGREVEIVDTGGNASTYNITVSSGSGESVEGSSSKTITSDYGSLSLRYFQAVSEWVEV